MHHLLQAAIVSCILRRMIGFVRKPRLAWSRFNPLFCASIINSGRRTPWENGKKYMAWKQGLNLWCNAIQDCWRSNQPMPPRRVTFRTLSSLRDRLVKSCFPPLLILLLLSPFIESIRDWHSHQGGKNRSVVWVNRNKAVFQIHEQAASLFVPFYF